MKPVIWCLVVIGMLTLMWSVAAERSYPATSSPRFLDQRLDVQAYEKISNGMSPDEVLELIGAEPTTTLKSISPKDNVSECRACWWNDKHQSMIKVLFYRGHVVDKFSSGLR